MGQGMDGMNESWEPEEIDEPQRRRVNTILPETERLRVEADGLYKRAKKAEEKNKTLTAERDQLRAEVDRLRGVVNDLGEMLGDVRKQRDAATARAEAAEALVAGLRGALEEAGDVIHACFCETEEIRGKVCHPSCIAINTALALTPASAGDRLKAEALREMAREIYRETDSQIARSIIELINERADLLTAEQKEAANGR